MPCTDYQLWLSCGRQEFRGEHSDHRIPLTSLDSQEFGQDRDLTMVESERASRESRPILCLHAVQLRAKAEGVTRVNLALWSHLIDTELHISSNMRCTIVR